MDKRIIGILVALVFLVGCGTEQKNDKQNNTKVISPSENAITYNCAGEIVKVDFNNDKDPKTADLFFVEKNTKITLSNVKAGSGVKYTDGDFIFWTHQKEAVLSMEEENKSLNCIEQPN